MKRNFERQIEIPSGVEAKLEGHKLSVKGPEGENSRTFKTGKVDFKIKDNKIILIYKNATKKEKKIINTNAAHIKNMIKGVQEKFVYELKIAASHFPMNVKIEGNKALIKNFIGEKVDRVCLIPKGAEVSVERGVITVKSVSKEIAGQAAANFETATRIRNRDRRTFQDGIYIINKAGKEI
jgi:large subunit ribosomal protein L6